MKPTKGWQVVIFVGTLAAIALLINSKSSMVWTDSGSDVRSADHRGALDRLIKDVQGDSNPKVPADPKVNALLSLPPGSKLKIFKGFASEPVFIGGEDVQIHIITLSGQFDYLASYDGGEWIERRYLNTDNSKTAHSVRFKLPDSSTNISEELYLYRTKITDTPADK